MFQFFLGWRRKAGCVTLLVACALMGGWWRSLVTFDEFDRRIGNTFYILRSAQGGIAFAANQTLDEGIERRIAWTSMPIPESCPQIDVNSVEAPKQGLEALGFYFGGNPDVDTICATPYWSIVLPLTLLSAYWLLRKPPKRVEYLTSSTVGEKS